MGHTTNKKEIFVLWDDAVNGAVSLTWPDGLAEIDCKEIMHFDQDDLIALRDWIDKVLGDKSNG
jgi:hypothetical protein